MKVPYSAAQGTLQFLPSLQSCAGHSQDLQSHRNWWGTVCSLRAGEVAPVKATLQKEMLKNLLI